MQLKIPGDYRLLLNDARTHLVIAEPDGSKRSEFPLSLDADLGTEPTARWLTSVLAYGDYEIPTDDALTQFAQHVHDTANLWPDPYTDDDLHSFSVTPEDDDSVVVAEAKPKDERAAGLRERMSSPPNFRVLDFEAQLRNGLPAPAFLLDRDRYPFLIENQVHWLTGKPEAGKSTIGLWLAKLYMDQHPNNIVVWVDWEAGEVPTLRRALAVGITEEQLVRQFMLTNWRTLQVVGDGDESRRAFSEMLHAVQELGVRRPLIVFDSASKALAASGLEENSAKDVTAFTTNLVMPLRDDPQVSATVIVIDHITKDASNTTYARGSGAKLADADAAWYVEPAKGKQVTKKQQGEVNLVRTKDRNGELPFGAALKLGDGQGGLPVTVDGIAWEQTTQDADDDHAIAAITDVLKLAPAEGLSSRKLADEVKALHGIDNRAALTRVAKMLAEDPTSAVQMTPAVKRGQPSLFFWDESKVISQETIDGLLSPNGTPGPAV